MKQSIRRHGLALFVIVVAAAVVAACGQVTTSEEAKPAGGLRAAQPTTARLVQDDVCVDGDPACVPTDAHGKHGAYACTVCHKYGGTLSFDRTGPAYGTGQIPSFNATTKTCSNVACHAIPAGVYEYEIYDFGSETYEPRSVPYGGTAAATPPWDATGLGCLACHDLKYQGTTTYEWHTGSHGQPMAQANSCQTCHLDATGTIGPGGTPSGMAISTATNCPPVAPTGTTECAKYHANGILNVTPVYRSGCFNCH